MKFVVGVSAANQLYIVSVRMDLKKSVWFLKLREENRRTAVQRKGTENFLGCKGTRNGT